MRLILPAALCSLAVLGCSEPPITATHLRCDDCAPTPRCGDGHVDDGEACDDGNALDTDACTSACVVARCGDGIVQADGEACDDANADDSDGCTAACVIGLVNGSFERGYGGWVLREDSDLAIYGAWGIGTSGVAIDPGDVVFDFTDEVSVPAACLGAPLVVTAAEGSAYAFNVQTGPEQHRLSQDVALAPTVTTLTWAMGYHDYAPFDAAAQYLAVHLRDVASDEILATLYESDVASPTDLPMTRFAADISAYAGTTVRVDVELQVQENCFDGVFDDFALH